MFRPLFSFTLALLVSLPLHAQTFRAAKQDLNRLYQDHPVTFYCGCKIDYQGKKMSPDLASCGYEPRKSRGGRRLRASRTRWKSASIAGQSGAA